MRNDDPGWPWSWRVLLWSVVPTLGYRRVQDHSDDSLVAMRQVLMSSALTIVAFGFVLGALYLSSDSGTETSAVVAIALLGAGTLVVAAVPRLEKPLDCRDDAHLAASYRQRFFLRLACSQVSTLMGFVGFFLVGALWTYLLGGAIGAFGLARAAPTTTHLAGDEEALQANGCGRSLVGALRGTGDDSGSGMPE